MKWQYAFSHSTLLLFYVEVEGRRRGKGDWMREAKEKEAFILAGFYYLSLISRMLAYGYGDNYM